MISKIYTRDYEGELVTDSLSWRDGNKEELQVWVPKTILNEDHSKSAHIIGNGPSILKYNLEFLKGQHGGADGIVSVGQSYGCNLIYTKFNPTFLICVNPEICNAIAKTNYAEDNIVYTTRRNLIKHKGIFHLYPWYETMYAGPLAARLACMDGHKSVYLIGFDFYHETIGHIFPEMSKSYKPIEDPRILNEKLIKQLVTVMQVYDDVQFYHVLPNNIKDMVITSDIEEFNWLPNVSTIGMNVYINRAGLGAVHKSVLKA